MDNLHGYRHCHGGLPVRTYLDLARGRVHCGGDGGDGGDDDDDDDDDDGGGNGGETLNISY